MINALPWAAVLIAIGLIQDSLAERLVPQVNAFGRRSTWLFVQTQPPGATVRLDGEPLGTSNELFLAPPGLHTLTLALPGYRTQRRPIEIPEKASVSDE